MTAVAIGMVVFMFVLVTSALEGMVLTFVGHIEATDAEIWVLPPSDRTLGMYLDAARSEDIRAIDGVAEVSPVLEVPAYLRFGDVESRVIVSGYEDDGMSRPAVIDGSVPSVSARGVVIDRSLVLAVPGIAVGESVEIAGERFEIAGVTEGHQLWAAYPVVFLPADVLAGHVGIQGQANYFLVRLADGASTGEVIVGIEAALPGTSAYTTADYMDDMLADFAFAWTIIRALQAITAAIGILIVGVTVYTSVLERTRELGIIKAIGGTSSFISRLVLLDGLLLAVPGFLIGASLALVAVFGLPAVIPIRVEFDPALFAAAGAMAAGVAIAGSAFGVRHALRIDPAVAIRGL